MSGAKHTPGEWTISRAANGDCGIRSEGTGIFIEVFAEIRHSGEWAFDEAFANAQLVVSSKKLLDALKLAVSVHDYDGRCGWIEQAKAAISKAEGR